MNYPYFSISFEKIACFEDRQNLSLDQKITLITGPNNSGKTVLLNQIKNAWLSAPSARPAGNPMAFFTDVISEQDERNAIQAGRYTLAPSQSLINKLISFPLVLQNNIEAEINIGKIKCDGVNLDALNKQSNERNSSGLTFYDFLEGFTKVLLANRPNIGLLS